MDSKYSLDPLIMAADRALRALFAPAHASRPVPTPAAPSDSAAGGNEIPTLSDSERRQAASLMRVNHAGEIAAQALYHGQAFASRSRETRELLLRASREEADHLAWCETRLSELNSHPSLLNPLWYVGSFAIGALASVAGDRTSLGFVVETEHQVEGHLNEHLARLPPGDGRSRAILEAMRQDEIAHGTTARKAGAAELPNPIRVLMRQVARIMTTTAYWV